jgi:hypothetical protein
MKKTLITMLAVIISTALNAQLKVVSNGNVAIGDTAIVPLSNLSIKDHGDPSYVTYMVGNTHGLFARHFNNNWTHWAYGVEGRSDNDNTNFSVGVKASAVTIGNVDSNGGRAFGVFARAGYATSGYNYAVFGDLMGTRNGAAIYGSTVHNDVGSSIIDNRYAGYFRGKTKVVGDLEVTGTVNGVVLSPTGTNLSSRLSIDNQEESSNKTIDKLSTLSVLSYYDSTTSASSSKTASKNTLDVFDNSARSDTLEIAIKAEPSGLELQRIEKQHYGIDVEQLEDAFPELVYTLDDGTKCVNYIEMVPLLVQSINELKSEIASLKKGDSAISKTKSTAAITDVEEETEMLSVSQNRPNPFTDKTTIELSIPESVSKASLFIYDMSGKQIDRIDIADRGTTNVSITSTGLTEGMYLYSFVADGKIVSTKRMILTK